MAASCQVARHSGSKGRGFLDAKEGADKALWVNAVFVLPELRRQGLGLALLQEAAAAASNCGEGLLFAYTDLRQLYLKAGWQELEQAAGQDEGKFVMQLVLA